MNNSTLNEITIEDCSYICKILLEFCDALSDPYLEQQILINHFGMSDLHFEELLTKIEQDTITTSEDKSPDELKELARNLRLYVTERGISEYLDGIYYTFMKGIKDECITSFLKQTSNYVDIETLKSFILVNCHPSTDEQEYIALRDSIIKNNDDRQNLQEISDYFRHLNSRYTLSDEEYANMVHGSILGVILEEMDSSEL